MNREPTEVVDKVRNNKNGGKFSFRRILIRTARIIINKGEDYQEIAEHIFAIASSGIDDFSYGEFKFRGM